MAEDRTTIILGKDANKETKIISDEKQKAVHVVGEIDYDSIACFDATIDRVLQNTNQQKNKKGGKKPLRIIIHSSGGIATTALGMYDLLREIDMTIVPVHTIVRGEAISAALVLAQAGRKRFIYPHSIIQFHSVIMRVKTDAKKYRDKDDFKKDKETLEEEVEHIEIINKNIFSILHERTKIPYKTIERFCYTSASFSAQKACELGVFDAIYRLD